MGTATVFTVLFGVLGGVALGFGIATFLRKHIQSARIEGMKDDAQRILEEAKKEAENIKKEAVLEAKELALKERDRAMKEVSDRKRDLEKREVRLAQKEEQLEKKIQQLDGEWRDLKQEKNQLNQRERNLERREKEIEALFHQVNERLEKIAQMTREEAKRELIENMKKEARKEAFEIVKNIEEKAKEEADIRAKKILALAIQKYSSDEVAEYTVSVVQLPSDEIKGRIIGREGRNIRAFESITGVDLIIDDTPEAVVLSCHDPIRREVARVALERLVKDGRIHPGRIEEIHAKVKKEIEGLMKEAASSAVFELGIHNLHPELLKLLGRLKYRTSYTQNMLSHSKEVAYFCGIMAAELGLNVELAKRMGLLHDIGKAVDHEVEGSHAQIGADLARKYGEKPEVVNAILAHHGEEEPKTPEAVLTIAADTLSAARPGARMEMLEAYVKRINKLEEIASSFPSVNKAYAIQAGREIRVIVDPESASDEELYFLAKDVAKKLEESLTYPGQIKVHVIRETRAVEYAK